MKIDKFIIIIIIYENPHPPVRKTQQDEDNEYNGPRQIGHNWTDFYGFNSVLDSRSMY